MDDAPAVEGQVVQNAEATAQSGSAPDKQTPALAPEQSSEKTQTTQEMGTEEGKESEGKKEDSIPYSRFKEVNDAKNAMERDMQSLRDKADKFDRLQSDPSFAEGLLSSGQIKQRNPELEEAENTLREMGYVKKEEVESLTDAKVKEYMEAARLAERFKELESEHDGSDGKPKFDVEDMFQYMQTEGIIGSVDPGKAYELRYMDELADARAKEIKSTPHSESQGPSDKSVGDDKASMLADAKKTGDFGGIMKNTSLVQSFIKHTQNE